ncbi:hypothetical protein ACFQO9_04745 [Chryseobacterium zhengzhouense]|uniref:Uncharacterized protein n=1 Tax=Chryseobacterium zhengzhouense TaxID=1636086 RepID=A0ABW2LWT8_9FLAO
MDFSLNKEMNNDEVTVMLALLDKDLQEMMLHCVKNKWRFEMIGSNNLQLYIPKDSLHLLFYLGHQVLSGGKLSGIEA